MSSTELGWQAFIATTSFGAGYTTLVCVSLTMDYEIQNWSGAPTRLRRGILLTVCRHVTLMTISVALVATAFNTFAARRLPMFEGMVLYLHILLWFGVCGRLTPCTQRKLTYSVPRSRLGPCAQSVGCRSVWSLRELGWVANHGRSCSARSTRLIISLCGRG
jgi:hypothetical protein